MQHDKNIGRVGRFRIDSDDNRWTWSAAMFELHGLEPGSVTPDRDLLLHYARPEYRAGLLASLTDSRSTECEYTLLASTGRERRVVLVADHAQDRIVSGYLIDVSTPTRIPISEGVTAEGARVQHSRAVIEQAKGVLMLAHGVKSARAFELLAWCSQHNNVKLTALADRLVRQVQIGAVAKPELGLRVDDLLLDCSMSAPPAIADTRRSTQRTVRIVQDDHATVIRLEGCGDLQSATELSRTCGALLTAARSGDALTVDLRAASEISLAIVSVLHAVYRRCKSSQVDVAVLVDRTVPTGVTRLDELPVLPATVNAAGRDESTAQ
jgi:anti-anti-sigma regulatory factor